jgi:hypothetical protein
VVECGLPLLLGVFHETRVETSGVRIEPVRLKAYQTARGPGAGACLRQRLQAAQATQALHLDRICAAAVYSVVRSCSGHGEKGCGHCAHQRLGTPTCTDPGRPSRTLNAHCSHLVLPRKAVAQCFAVVVVKRERIIMQLSISPQSHPLKIVTKLVNCDVMIHPP